MKTYKLKLELPYNTATKLQGIFLKEQKIYLNSEICTQIFITTLIIVVKCENGPEMFINRQVNEQSVMLMWNIIYHKNDY